MIILKGCNITGSLIKAYLFCPRQAWLLARQILGNQDNDFLSIGRFVSKKSYEREKKEIVIDGGKVDFLKSKDGEILVVEVKKSSKFIKTAKFQLLFYLYQLEKSTQKVEGEIRIPNEKKIIKVSLTNSEKLKLEKLLKEIKSCISLEHPPKVKFSAKCKRCSYVEFCFS